MFFTRCHGLRNLVARMVNEDKNYADIVQQFFAIHAALSQTRDEIGKKVAIELKDTVSNII